MPELKIRVTDEQAKVIKRRALEDDATIQQAGISLLLAWAEAQQSSPEHYIAAELYARLRAEAARRHMNERDAFAAALELWISNAGFSSSENQLRSSPECSNPVLAPEVGEVLELLAALVPAERWGSVLAAIMELLLARRELTPEESTTDDDSRRLMRRLADECDCV